MQGRVKKGTIAAIVPALALSAMVAGGASAQSEAPASPGGPAAEKCTGQHLSFILSFIPNVQHAGFLVASARGFYADEGLDVEIVPAGPNVDPVASVGDGSASLGQVDYGQLLRAREAGVPIKSIAQTYQKSFLNWYSSKDSGIATVADWKGHTVGQIQVGEDPEVRLMLASVGLTPEDITATQQSFGIDDYVGGKVEVGTGVVFFHPAAFNGMSDMTWPDDFNVFTPDDNGAPIASQTVATSEDLIANDPAALTCFLRASIRGWQETFRDPAAAVTDVMTFIPEGAIPEPHQQAAIGDVLPIVGTGADDPNILRIDPARYQESIDLLSTVDYFETEPPAAADTYDLSFFEAAVGG